jgi:hypothetical protein
MADAVSSGGAFVMRGARTAMALGLGHVEEQVAALERAVVETPGLAFDLAKTLVESACRTILSERKQAYGADDDLPKLFRVVTTFLPLAPPSPSGNPGGQKSLKQTLNGLHTALQGICELRNDFGFASHGSDGPRPRMESIQAMLAAQAADAIVGFLHAAHKQNRADQKSMPLRFEEHADFNDFIDGAHASIQIFQLSFRASEVLFCVDLEAYRDALANFNTDEAGETDETAHLPVSSAKCVS